MTRCGGPDVYEYEFLNGLHLFLPGTITVCYCGVHPRPPQSAATPSTALRVVGCNQAALCSPTFSPTKVSCFRSASGDYFTLGTMRDSARLRSFFFHCKNVVISPSPPPQGEELECDFGTEQRYEATWINSSTVKCSGVTVSSGPPRLHFFFFTCHRLLPPSLNPHFVNLF